MCTTKKLINKSLALIVTGVPMAAFAHLNIISAEGRTEVLKPLSVDDGVYKQVVDVGNKKFINHPVKSFANDLPLGLALPSIIPSGWVIDITDKLSEFPVSWEKTGNWDDVIVEISKRHDLVVAFDWDRHILKIKINDAEMLEFIDNPVEAKQIISNSGQTSPCESKIDQSNSLSGDVQTVTDSLVNCGEANSLGCSSPKVDIEKLVLDTEWLADEGNDEIDSNSSLVGEELLPEEALNEHEVNPSEISALEEQEQLDSLEDAIKRDKKMKADYRSSVILHGDGSYEDFVNGGGKVEHADPDTQYVYVFKRGKLFDTVNKWAELNGFYVENEIFDQKRVDYPNSQDIKIKGTFKDVTTLLLNKYRKAEVPVNHKYFVGGGSSTLHIFESKYESLYVN